MPGFRFHTTINIVALPVFAYTASARFAVSSELVAIFAASFAIATFLLSPDLDLRQSSPPATGGRCVGSGHPTCTVSYVADVDGSAFGSMTDTLAKAIAANAIDAPLAAWNVVLDTHTCQVRRSN